MKIQTAASSAQIDLPTAATASTDEDLIYSLVTRRLLPVLLTAFCIAYLTVQTHSTAAGMFLLAGFMVFLGGLLPLVTPGRLVNK